PVAKANRDKCALLGLHVARALAWLDTEGLANPPDETCGGSLRVRQCFELVERFGKGKHRLDFHAGGSGWGRLWWFTPYEKGLRGRFGCNVKAILCTIVDDRIQIERGRYLAARSVDDEDTRKVESVRLKPSLRLNLRGLSCTGRSL